MSKIFDAETLQFLEMQDFLKSEEAKVCLALGVEYQELASRVIQHFGRYVTMSRSDFQNYQSPKIGYFEFLHWEASCWLGEGVAFFSDKIWVIRTLVLCVDSFVVKNKDNFSLPSRFRNYIERIVINAPLLNQNCPKTCSKEAIIQGMEGMEGMIDFPVKYLVVKDIDTCLKEYRSISDQRILQSLI